MTNEEFRYWINGYLTLTSEEKLDAQQVQIIHNHANLVAATVGHLDADVKTFVDGLMQYIVPNAELGFLK